MGFGHGGPNSHGLAELIWVWVVFVLLMVGIVVVVVVGFCFFFFFFFFGDVGVVGVVTDVVVVVGD